MISVFDAVAFLACTHRVSSPLWSILGTREPEGETAIKTKMCSPRDVFDMLSAEIRHLVSQIPLRRGRTSYKSESTSKDGSTNPITTVNTIQNKYNQIIMSLPLHSHATCDKIHQHMQTLCCYDDGGVMPPLQSNNVPHPDPLRNSAIYYPLLPLSHLQRGYPCKFAIWHV